MPGTEELILTYLANLLRAGTNATPYSMVTAAGPPYTPADMRDDEMLVNQWLADDLQVKPGDWVELSYSCWNRAPGSSEPTNRFRVRGIVPLSGHICRPHADAGVPGHGPSREHARLGRGLPD